MTIKDVDIPGFKKVIKGEDPTTGLKCFVAIHDTTLGPTLGGTRIYPYSSEEEALQDVLRLAEGMTLKSSLAKCGLGGGKSVIIADPKNINKEQLLLAFAEVVNALQGEYIAAEDVGSSTEDMAILRQKTPYVSCLATSQSSGDPSRFTARGVFLGMQAVAQHLWGSRSLQGKTIAIQGIGHVGSLLASILFWEGADLILSDVDTEKVEKLAHYYGARVVPPQDFLTTPCDILAPCALGGILTKHSIPNLQCQAVAGAANNQLAEEEDGRRLMESGILYAPDFVINVGGLINAVAEFEPDGYHPKKVRDKVQHIYDTLLEIFQHSAKEKRPTQEIAHAVAKFNIQHQIGKRIEPIKFH